MSGRVLPSIYNFPRDYGFAQRSAPGRAAFFPSFVNRLICRQFIFSPPCTWLPPFRSINWPRSGTQLTEQPRNNLTPARRRSNYILPRINFQASDFTQFAERNFSFWEKNDANSTDAVAVLDFGTVSSKAFSRRIF